jgi:eukaryotic-like serine/threonine-protein kinase
MTQPNSAIRFKQGAYLGPYQIEHLIASGGMGEVYRARDTRLDRAVALKVLGPSFTMDSDRMARFTREARTMALLNHPNIVAIYDMGSEAGTPYVVSEFLQGSTLRRRLRDGALSVRSAITFALDIVGGLVAAHGAGVVHRDLKPENVFITRDHRVKILDFGLAKCRSERVAAPSNDSAVSTQPGMLLGTVGYMSPEQVRGDKTDHRSDIFSVGVVLHEMISGVAPFRGDSAIETMYAILKEETPVLPDRRGAVPDALGDVVDHCLEKDADERFQSAKDLAFALRLVGRSARPVRRLRGPRRFLANLWRGAAI